jgi:tetratricopeptide (TPR) repeat protein/transcriptional regulator with XRE-family HTH domain
VTDSPVEAFGGKLKRLRESKGLTRQALARLTGVNGVAWPTIRDLEHGIRLPRPRTLTLLAEALDLDKPTRAEFEAAARALSAQRQARARTTPAGALGSGPELAAFAQAGGLGEGSPARTLPYDTGSFTGRFPELRSLADGALAVGETGRTSVFAIEGMGGVGKTALAVHAAHRVTGESPDLFPDGHLFLDLHGYTPGVPPLTANEALRSLLRQLGVPHEVIPAKQVPREALYRSTLAGKKALLILDNAKDAAQVRPLLPGTAACLVLVTSRETLRSLDGVTALRLETPPEAEAIALFRKVAGPAQAGPDDSALPADPELAEIVRLCGYLPLAVQIAAARLSRRPALGLSDLIAELREEHRRLSHLQDKDRGVRVAFQSSLRYLAPAEKELFTRLGRVPGTDFDACAAASLCAGGLEQTRDRLELLLDQHLLVQRSPGRYELHDLARLFAREVADPGAEQATGRLLNFYLYAAQAADRLFERGLPSAGPPAGGAVKPAAMPALSSSADAQGWLALELRNLIAAANHAAEAGLPRVTVGMSAALSDYLRAHGPWAWARRLHTSAHQAAIAAGDRRGQASALRSLGGVHSRTGDIPASLARLGEALIIYRDLNDWRGAGRALIELGIAQRVAGATADSHASLTEALGIYQRLGDRLGEAAALNELGSVRWQTGPISEAERHVLGALTIFRELANRQGQAAALLYLGNVQLTMGTLAEAEASFREAGTIGVGLRHPVLVANSLLYLGDVQRSAGQLDDARDSLESAHRIYTRISHRQGRATSLAYLGRTLSLAGDYPEADARLAAALALFDELDDPSDKAEVLNARGSVAHAVGESAAARGYREEALRLATVADSSRERGAALLGLAVLDAEADERDAALSRARAALALYMAMENEEGITRAREILCQLREPG